MLCTRPSPTGWMRWISTRDGDRAMARYHVFILIRQYPPKVIYGGIDFCLGVTRQGKELRFTVTKKEVGQIPVELLLSSSFYGPAYLNRKLYTEGIWMEPDSAQCRFMEFMVKDGFASVS